jgi:DNA invertase Pin-like site-specific DNA recombinase
MMLTMLAGFAEFERALTVERTTTALAYKRNQRQVYGPTPFGYRRKGAALVAHRGEFATVARVQAWRAEGLSLRAIAERLTAANVATKRGGHWAPRTVTYLLQNELYTPAAEGAAT